MDKERRSKELMEKLQNLLDSHSTKLGDLLKNKENFDFPAVYVFYKPKSEEVVYVGRTKTKNINGRMKDHKGTNGSSDMNIMIKGRAGFPQEVEEYIIKFLRIENKRERMFFENFVISILKPELNKEG